jgi:hypothetical protein
VITLDRTTPNTEFAKSLIWAVWVTRNKVVSEWPKKTVSGECRFVAHSTAHPRAYVWITTWNMLWMVMYVVFNDMMVDCIIACHVLIRMVLC